MARQSCGCQAAAPLICYICLYSVFHVSSLFLRFSLPQVSCSVYILFRIFSKGDFFGNKSIQLLTGLFEKSHTFSKVKDSGHLHLLHHIALPTNAQDNHNTTFALVRLVLGFFVVEKISPRQHST